jgi:flagellar biosynthesis/type III secretory pathway M-ring protein FliF/YscJ
MGYDKYIFLDYESIQDVNFNIINKRVKVVIITGNNEINMSVDLLNKIQPFGNSIEWIQIENNENEDTLYYFIINKLGYYTFNQGNKEFVIYSKNKEYDPLIENYKDKKINLIRIENLTHINKTSKYRFINKPLKYVSFLWSKFTIIQKILLIGIILAVIASLIVIHKLTQTQNLIPVFSTPVYDEERWTANDFTNNENFHRAQIQMITKHIKSLEDIDNANVSIVFSNSAMFPSEQNPVSASLIITPKPGSDITTNRKKIEGIQKLLKIAIEGLKDENIVITDQNGLLLNNFE